jgi:hypothetical protein
MKNPVLKTLAILLLIAIPIFTTVSLNTFSSLEVTNINEIQGLFFVILSLIEALVFEAGVLSLFLVRPIISKLPNQSIRKYAKMVYYALLWLLMSWWPHDWAHAHNLIGTWGLIRIEYAFHLTSMIAAMFAIYGFVSLLQVFLEEQAKRVG